LQARLAAIVESSDDAIVSKSLDGVIQSWNGGAERLFGYKAEEIIGRHVSVLAAPDRVDEIPAILERVSRGERIDHYETKRKTKDGRILTVSLSVSPIRDGSGRVIGASKVARDIGNQERLLELQARLAAIVESSDDAIVSKDLNGVIQSWNSGAERLFGYTAGEVIGKSISIIIPPDRLGEEREILDRLKRGERVEHFETIRRRKDGAPLNISLAISPVKDAYGKVIGASKVARDITERKRQEQALRAANEALSRSNADLQQFAYSASHDLQEPLRMVAAYSELLNRDFAGKLGPAGEEYLGYTLQGALRMEQLLSDLRLYMQVSTSAQEPAQDCDSGRILDKALANLEAAIRANGVSITRISLPSVRIHDFQLEQLFQNLIGNAIRYRRSDPPQIHVEARRQGADWLFSVRDNGIGIEPQYKEQIFAMFKRLHSAADYPGAGMGLAICQRIVERIGGRIWVESEPGRGSTFFFTIPVREQ
jgi:PAS domain S-box-containing protein